MSCLTFNCCSRETGDSELKKSTLAGGFVLQNYSVHTASGTSSRYQLSEKLILFLNKAKNPTLRAAHRHWGLLNKSCMSLRKTAQKFMICWREPGTLEAGGEVTRMRHMVSTQNLKILPSLLPAGYPQEKTWSVIIHF